MQKKFESWKKINAELIAMLNHHIAIIKQRLQERIELCPIVAFLDNSEIKSYVQNIKDPKDYPKISDIYKLAKGVKDSTNIFAVMIAYTQKINNNNYVVVELEHRSGDCIKISMPIITAGIFHKKASISTTDKFIVEELKKIVWND